MPFEKRPATSSGTYVIKKIVKLKSSEKNQTN